MQKKEHNPDMIMTLAIAITYASHIPSNPLAFPYSSHTPTNPSDANGVKNKESHAYGKPRNNVYRTTI